MSSKTYKGTDGSKEIIAQFSEQSKILDLLISHIVIPKTISLYSKYVEVLIVALQCSKATILTKYKECYTQLNDSKSSKKDFILEELKNIHLRIEQFLSMSFFPFGIKGDTVAIKSHASIDFRRHLDLPELVLEKYFLQYLINTINGKSTIIDRILKSWQLSNEDDKDIDSLKMFKILKKLCDLGVFNAITLGDKELGSIKVFAPQTIWKEKLLNYAQRKISIKGSAYWYKTITKIASEDRYFESISNEILIQQRDVFLLNEDIRKYLGYQKSMELFEIKGEMFKSMLLEYIHNPILYQAMYDFENSKITLSVLDQAFDNVDLDIFIYSPQVENLLGFYNRRIEKNNLESKEGNKKITPRQVALKYFYLQLAEDSAAISILEVGAKGARVLSSRYNVNKANVEKFIGGGQNSIRKEKNRIQIRYIKDLEIVSNLLKDNVDAKLFAEKDLKAVEDLKKW